MIDSWNYDPSQRSNNKRCNLRWLVTVLSYQLSLIARYHGPQPPAAPARLSSLLSELLGPVSGLWLEKIMKAGVEWLLTTATGSPGWAQSSHYDWERAREQQFYCEPSITWRRVTSVIETYICTKLKIMSIMCLLSVWESQQFLLKNVPKSCLW